MGDVPGFPTQGEVIRFAYRVAGVLPEKHDPMMPRCSSRASMRKAIARLAQEEGKLEENFGDLLTQLSSLLFGYVTWLPAHLLIGDVLNDFIEDYRNLLSEEGTYLDRHATVRWLIRDRWVAGTIVSLARNAWKWKPAILLPLRPSTEDWFLPDFTEQGVIWPMRKVLEWLYQVADLSQTQFHYPGRDADEADVEKQRQLENAQNWVSGRSLPSAAALQASFRSAIKDRAETITALSDPKRRLSAESVLHFGRMSTAIWQSVIAEFGEAYAKDLRVLCGRLWTLLMGELGALERELLAASIETKLSRTNYELRRDLLVLWGRDVARRSNAAGNEMSEILCTGCIPSDDQFLQLSSKYGSLPVETLAIPLRSGRAHDVPEGFLDAFGEWSRLRKSAEASAQDIDAFQEFLDRHQLAVALGWMPAWLRFQQAYRRRDYAAAWTSISMAFELAKYRAGKDQYEIVNQYVEMAAKCGTPKEFRRGVSWARYIGQEIRWIRDRPLTAENLSFAKAILQRAIYSI